MDRNVMVKMAADLRKITLKIENAKGAKASRGQRSKKASSAFDAEVAERNAKVLLSLINAKKELDADLEEVAGDMLKRRDELSEQIKLLKDEFRKTLDPAADRVLDLHGVMLRYSAHERKMPVGYQTAWDRVQARVAEKLGAEIAGAVTQIIQDMKESLSYTQKLITQLEVLDVASQTSGTRKAGLLTSLVSAFEKLKPMIMQAVSVFKLAKKRITENSSSVKTNLDKLMGMQDEAAEALEV